MELDITWNCDFAVMIPLTFQNITFNMTWVKSFIKKLDDCCTVKLGDKEDFDKEQIGVKATISHDQLSIYW